MADKQTCEVRLILVPLTLGPYSVVWLYIKKNTKLWYINSLYSVKHFS
jgi:hypothetical protein